MDSSAIEQNVRRADNPVTDITAQIERAVMLDGEESVRKAMVAYLDAKALKEEFERLQETAKKVIDGVIDATGQTKWNIDGVGVASLIPGAVRTMYDYKALDAICKSDAVLDRILKPHRSETQGNPVLRISAEKKGK